MVGEVLEALMPRAGGRYLDGTLGGGSHAAAVLGASSPNGWLYGCDRDGVAVDEARERLADFAGRFELRQCNFADIGDWVPAGSCDGALLDLGVSSAQLDVAGRGFSFQGEGPLDMRMDQRSLVTAWSLLDECDAEELARIFWEFGGERESRRLARALVKQREQRRFETTRQLAEFIEKISPRRGRATHPATKVFQALRIAVNDEIGSLKRGLDVVLTRLKPGGRMAVITFHSLEDRLVKEFTRERAREYTTPGGVDVPELRQERVPEARLVTRKAVKPSEGEVETNPRSRSAQLRVIEKV
jgi:16S rRNA (cytosine1402-N4)-methyltransferase